VYRPLGVSPLEHSALMGILLWNSGKFPYEHIFHNILFLSQPIYEQQICPQKGCLFRGTQFAGHQKCPFPMEFLPEFLCGRSNPFWPIVEFDNGNCG